MYTRSENAFIARIKWTKSWKCLDFQPDVSEAIQTEIGKGANHVLQSPSVNLEIAWQKRWMDTDKVKEKHIVDNLYYHLHKYFWEVC